MNKKHVKKQSHNETNRTVPLPKNGTPAKFYTITTTHGEFEFYGWYRRDLETDHWHYYENDSGNLVHFRKEHMVSVLEENLFSQGGIVNGNESVNVLSGKKPCEVCRKPLDVDDMGSFYICEDCQKYHMELKGRL